MNRIILRLAFLFPAAFLYGQAQKVPSAPAPPDTSIRRFEVGGQATDMRLAACFGSEGCPEPQFGLGVGAALNLSPHFSIDSACNMLPRYDSYHLNFINGAAQGGHAAEFLVGGKAQVRAKRYAFYSEVRPGLVSWSQALTGYTFTQTGSNTPVQNNIYGRRNFLAVDVGGGAEYSFGSRVHIRMDMGDLLVRYNTQAALNYPGTVISVCQGACHPWVNNLQTTAGVYWSAGKPLVWTPPDARAAPTHRFFSSTNFALLAVSLLGQAADAVTTQRFLSHGYIEADPLARPFVKYGWSGQIGLAVLVNGVEISGMYGLHRMHQHRIERIVPLVVAAASGVSAYRNQAGQ